VGTTCYLKCTVRIGAMGSVLRIGGRAIGVGFHWAFRKTDLQYVYREMLKLLPGVIYISGSLGTINFPSELPHSALRVDLGCPPQALHKALDV